MAESVIQSLLASVESAKALYHRLVLLVGPVGSGKTSLLRLVAEKVGVRVVNVNLELSQALLDVPRGQRAFAAPRKLNDSLSGRCDDPLLLDNIEMLFAPDLQLDPLRALQQLSRDRTVVAVWNGCCHAGRLTYAEPGHPEHRDYSAQGLLIVQTEHTESAVEP